MCRDGAESGNAMRDRKSYDIIFGSKMRSVEVRESMWKGRRLEKVG